jgi:hypothetical protein
MCLVQKDEALCLIQKDKVMLVFFIVLIAHSITLLMLALVIAFVCHHCIMLGSKNR